MRGTCKESRINVPESGVLRACLDLLAAERIWHRRWNSGAIRNAKGRPVFFGRKGDADILALFQRLQRYDCGMCHGDMVVLWIEAKSDTGAQRPEQEEFQRQVEEAGHYYLVVRSSDDLLRWLKEHR
jgi:hypothetical protein